MAMWNDYEKIARRLDRIANAFERIAKALETANIIEADRKTEPQTENPCDGCVCDDGKHLMYCMNCKGIAWKTEPPKTEQTERSE